MLSAAKHLCQFLLLLLSLSPYVAPAQIILTGTAHDATGKPLEGILIEAETKTQPSVSAFVISGADGSFKLTLPATPASDSLRLSARALGYAEQFVRLANRSQPVVLTMRESTTQLEEVVVQGSPITRSHDTLSYKVDAFASKQDRVISDVLKKMPGIEVGSDGQISYEGKPISKFYINGQDLLENRYNLASDNLPAGAVQSVQVLENHQPIRALDSLIRPDNAALNIKLKNKVTATGQARLGAGLVPRPGEPGRWQANLSPMLFVAKQQLIDTYQTNNTGQDVLAELKPLGLDDLRQQLESSNRKPDLTHIQGLGQPPIASNRYLFNKAHLFSANHLLTLSKEQQVRLNLSYLHDAQVQAGSTQTLYVLPGQAPVTLTEQKQNHLYFNNLLVDLAFIKNVKKYYLKNTLSFSGAWDSQVGEVRQVERGALIAQQARNPFLAFTNRLGLVQPISQGRLVQVNSLVFYTTSPQQLVVSPGPFAGTLNGGAAYDTARQQARLGSFFTSNSVSLISGHKRWGFTKTLGFSEEVQHLTSSLDLLPAPAADPLRRNDLAWVRGKYYAQPAFSYKADTWNASLEVPISYWHFTIADAPLATAQRLRTVTAEPRLNLHYNLGALWYVSGGTDLTNRFGDITQLNYAYLLRDYRTLQRSAAPLARSLAWSANVGLYYKNPLTSWFYHATYRFSRTERNLLYSSTVQPDGALTTVAVAQYSQALTHTFSGSASKFVSPLKTNLSAQLSANVSQQPQLLNGTLTQSQTRSATATFKASVSAFDWGSLEYSANLSALRSTVAEAAAPPLSVLQDHHAALSFYPKGRQQLLLAADYYDSRGPAPRVQNVFADATYRYTLPTARKLDIELKVSNIFDSQQYQYVFVSQFILTQNVYALRPRQVLASVRLSL